MLGSVVWVEIGYQVLGQVRNRVRNFKTIAAARNTIQIFWEHASGLEVLFTRNFVQSLKKFDTFLRETLSYTAFCLLWQYRTMI